MAENSTIEWTDSTWNPITGCTLVSEGCRHCYAARLTATRLKHHPSRQGLARINAAGEAKFTGEVRFNEQWLTQPLSWKRPRRIFVCAHGDLFHESVPDEWIDRVFAVMALAYWHTFQVLTKRPERARAYLTGHAQGGRHIWEAGQQIEMPGRWLKPDPGWPLPNVWLGTSVEDQKNADERIPQLLAAPAAVRFLSAEPLLGPIDLRSIPWPKDRPTFPETDDLSEARDALRVVEGTKLDWIIVGGESGPHARPMHPDWARSLRDQCAAAGVPFFFKQWGEWAPVYERDIEDPDWRRCDVVDRDTPNGRWMNLAGGHGFHGERVVRMDRLGKKRAGRLLDGREWNEWPEARP